MDNKQLVFILGLVELRSFVLDHPDDEITPIAKKGCEHLLNQIKRTIHIKNVGKQQVLNRQQEFQGRSQVEQQNVSLKPANKMGDIG